MLVPMQVTNAMVCLTATASCRQAWPALPLHHQSPRRPSQLKTETKGPALVMLIPPDSSSLLLESVIVR